MTTGDRHEGEVPAHVGSTTGRGMLEEYARHNGHADLPRERIDGRIGQ